MSALMFSCMSLLGRSQDRVCHVLVNEPYEQKMEPPFLFPESGVAHKLDGKTYFSGNAHPVLSDIPFVRVRGWYEKEFNKVPPSYMQLVNKVQGIAPKPANYPVIKLDAVKGLLLVDKISVPLSGSEFALVYLMLCRIKNGNLPSSWYDLEPDFTELLGSKVPTSINWFHSLKEKGVPDAEDFRKWAASARLKLRKVFNDPVLPGMLLPSMRVPVAHTYPADKIKIAKGLS